MDPHRANTSLAEIKGARLFGRFGFGSLGGCDYNPWTHRRIDLAWGVQPSATWRDSAWIFCAAVISRRVAANTMRKRATRSRSRSPPAATQRRARAPFGGPPYTAEKEEAKTSRSHRLDGGETYAKTGAPSSFSVTQAIEQAWPASLSAPANGSTDGATELPLAPKTNIDITELPAEVLV